ncbi:MAG: exonuclease SbcCD subunit D [Corynebacterium sp.]|nr:exonuclease SbcCD subunit D [Corynebacterium sp.]
MQVRFIHTSDWQLGMTRWFLRDEAQARFSDDRIRCIEAIGALATERVADFIVCAGDVFDDNNLSFRTLGRAREVLTRLPVPIYLLPGNHDPFDAAYKLDAVEAPGVHVLTDTAVHRVDGRDDVEIVGAPWTSKNPFDDLAGRALADLEPVASGRARILVAHGQVAARTSEPTGDVIDLAGLEHALADRVIDYVALGDTHSTTDLSPTGRVWFSGAPLATDFREVATGGGEADSGNVLVVTITVDGTQSSVEVERVPVGMWRFEALTCELTNTAEVDRFLQQLAEYPDKARTVVKYWLTGAVSMVDYARLQAGLEKYESIFAALFPRQRSETVTVYPTDEEIDNLRLTPFARSAVDTLRAGAGSRVDTDALHLLYRLVERS